MIADKIKDVAELKKIRQQLKEKKKKVVFSNGVIDILHRGHVEYLEQARQKGDVLILGLNSDRSARKLKGAGRPIVPQQDRAFVLAGLECVDYVCLFDEETPAALIREIRPDVLVKGGDYKIEDIVGREVVRKSGGEVLTIPTVPGKSTSGVLGKIVQLVKKGILSE
ncbi:MAG TPA: D-glycero-beta-D-manno-heptose 1-phosphate adenylyltransferase [Caldithrix sp.]|nr:D-glycero-beta-D-manno-heptose 1-phosphate adenylyltransferase [Caldithrix sp.]